MGMLTEQDRAQRALGIGGSEAAAAIGVHQSITPLDLYRFKIYREKLPMATDEFGLWLGHQLEPVVAAAWSRKTGSELEESKSNLQHDDHPFIRGFIDRKVAGKNEGVELKAWSPFSRSLWGEPGSDDVPISVLVQCVHYMIVTGWDCWHVGVLLGTEFRDYVIERDAGVIDMVLEKEIAFWQHVVDEVPPPAMNLNDIRYLYQRAKPGATAIATSEDIADHALLYDLRGRISALEHERDEIEFRMRSRLKDAGRLVHPDDEDYALATWNDYDQRRADSDALKKDGLWDAYSKEVPTRPLRLSPPAEGDSYGQ